MLSPRGDRFHRWNIDSGERRGQQSGEFNVIHTVIDRSWARQTRVARLSQRSSGEEIRGAYQCVGRGDNVMGA